MSRGIMLGAGWPALLTVAVLALAGADVVAADTDKRGDIDVLDQYEDPETRAAHFEALGPIDRYLDAKKRLRETTGLGYVIEYAPMVQFGSHGGSENVTANHELNFIMDWKLFERPTLGTGGLLGWFQDSVTLNDVTTSEFQEASGILSPVNGGDTAPETAAARLQLLAWQHLFLDERLQLLVGKLTTRVTSNLNRYAVSDREDFFSPMIVNNVVVPYTARLGLGAYARYRTDDLYVSTMVREADGTTNWIDFDTLGSGRWESVSEVALTPQIAGVGPGMYRFTYSYTDRVGPGQPPGSSYSLSADQDLGARVGAFVRYAYADAAFRTFRQRFAAGAQIKAPLGYEHDRIGIAGWWGRPTSGRINHEYGLELFWKLQVARLFEFTPDLQLVFDPADADAGVRVVGGLRLRVVL